MAPKRPHGDDSASPPLKKQKKGFSVGPANLPDGSYKRKVQKIKKDLIRKAKLKKEYAKLRDREQPIAQKSVYDSESHDQDEPTEPASEPSLEPHPDRLKLLEGASPQSDPTSSSRPTQRRRRPRSQPYGNETELAQRRKEETDLRRKAREEAGKERQKKHAERERFRKAMAKARGGPDGKRKLGRESVVLLEKVKKLVSNS